MDFKKLIALGLTATVMLSGAAFADGETGAGGGTEVTDPAGPTDPNPVEKFTLTVDPTENCTVSIDGDSTISSKEAEKDTNVVLKAEAAEGYEFVNWTDLDGKELSAENPYTVTVTENTTVKAVVKETEKTEPTVSITGTAKVGETLTAEVTNVAEGTEISYQWSMASVKTSVYKDIENAKEKTLALTDDMENKYIKVTATIGTEEPTVLTAIADTKVASSDNAPVATVVTIDYSKEVIKYDEAKYVVANEDKSKVISSYSSSLAEDDIGYIVPGKAIYVKKIAADASDDSVWTKIELPARPVMTQEVYATNASYGSKDGKLTNFVAGKMEYKLSTESTWHAVNKQGVYNLAPGEYWVRLRATDESFSSEYKTVIVGQDSKASPGSSGESSGGGTYYSKNGIYGKTDTVAPTTPSTSAKASFDDIDGHWAKAEIVRAVEKGLFSGVSDNEFDPDGTTTRGMIVTLVARLDGAELDGYTESKFADVSMDDYFGKSVAWASDKGVVTGVDENSFDPNASLTREQIAVILYRYAKFAGKDTSATADISGFADYANVSEYAVEALSWANGAGIVSGRDGNMLEPKGTATRAEVATMLMRFTDNIK